MTVAETAAGAGRPLTARDWTAPYRLAPHCIFDPSRFNEPATVGLDLAAAFDIAPAQRLFILGSCFARDAMHGLLKRAQQRLQPDSAPLLGTALGHKYSAFSILQALDFITHASFDEQLIIKIADRQYFDGHRHPVVLHPSRREAHALHLAALDETRLELQSADVVSLTVETIEVWYDDAFDVPLNTPPPIDPGAGFSDRFRFRRTTYEENRNALIHVFQRIAAMAPGVRILAAVSPIPLYATFTGEDILVANTYCKSILHAALKDAIDVARSSEIDARYCPTYELVTSQPRRDDVWRCTDPAGHPDGRHLDESFAHRIVAGALRLARRTP